MACDGIKASLVNDVCRFPLCLGSYEIASNTLAAIDILKP